MDAHFPHRARTAAIHVSSILEKILYSPFESVLEKCLWTCLSWRNSKKHSETLLPMSHLLDHTNPMKLLRAISIEKRIKLIYFIYWDNSGVTNGLFSKSVSQLNIRNSSKSLKSQLTSSTNNGWLLYLGHLSVIIAVLYQYLIEFLLPSPVKPIQMHRFEKQA